MRPDNRDLNHRVIIGLGPAKSHSANCTSYVIFSAGGRPAEPVTMPSDQDRIKQLARLGENYFDKLCIEAGGTNSFPGHDEFGWDRLVEFPQDHLPGTHLDAQPAPIKLVCQIKATDHFADRSISMKVSNFVHLARNPFPAFVLVLNYANNNEPVQSYLCHFGRERVSQTLKRLRELEAKEDYETHKHTMTFPVEEAEHIPVRDSAALRSAIVRHSGPDLKAYVQDKMHLLGTLGYDESRYRLSFISRITIADWIDASLGLRKIHIESGEISTVRFGVELKDHDFESGVLSIEPVASGACDIVVSSKSIGRRVHLRGDVFAPPMLGLPTEAFKIRIVSGQIQSTLAGTNCNIKFAFDPEVSYDLNELISNVEFMWLSAQADSKIEFFKDSIRFAILEGQHEETIDPFFPALLKRAESIKRFLDKAGHSDRFLVRPKEIFEQEEALKWIQIVVEPGPHEVSTELAVDSTLASVKEPGLFANPVAFSSNGLHYIALCYWQATVEIAGQQVRAELGDCNIWSFVAIEDTDADNFRAIYNEYREFCAERADGTLLMRELEERGADRTSKEIDQK